MARGPKTTARPKSKTNIFKNIRPSLVLGGSITSNRPSTSCSNRFSILSDPGDMDVIQESNIVEEVRQPKPPPIVADTAVTLREIQHLLGTDCIYKRTSVGTKIFPSNFDKYEFCKKKRSKRAKLNFIRIILRKTDTSQLSFMVCQKWIQLIL